MKPYSLKNFKCRYHRNGVSGIGFFFCAFWHDGNSLEAVVFPESEYYAIVTMNNVDQRWRGDHFIDAIRERIELCKKDGTAYAEATEPV